MKNFFIYTREAQVKKLDEQGQAIPKLDEKGLPVPGQFETEIKKRKDIFAISRIVRVHMIDDNHVIVLLSDGHETTEKTPELKNPNKPASPSNIIEVKSRVWVQSEISIKGDDVQRLYDLLETA